MSKDPILLRKFYLENPPLGFSVDEIRNMSLDQLLDMDYFLNDDDPFAPDVDLSDGFFIF